MRGGKYFFAFARRSGRGMRRIWGGSARITVIIEVILPDAHTDSFE